MQGSSYLKSRGFDVKGWQILYLRAASDDGTVLIGEGWNPQGKFVLWLAR